MVTRETVRPRETRRRRRTGLVDRGMDCRSAANCRTSVHLLLTIDTGDEGLSLPKLGRRRLPVLYCLNCMSWRPLYIDYSAETPRVVSQAKEERANDDLLLDERPVYVAPLASAHTSTSKVGGAPKWLQGPEVPQCTGCAEPMTFFAQLRSLPDWPSATMVRCTRSFVPRVGSARRSFSRISRTARRVRREPQATTCSADPVIRPAGCLAGGTP